MQQPIDNKYERFEDYPAPMQLRIFELMSALTGALGLPETPESPAITEVKMSEQEQRLAEVKSLSEARVEREQKTDAEIRAEEARAIVERVAA